MYVVFDIDGTLTDTTSVDGRAYFRALAEVFGDPFGEVRIDWRSLDDITDATIFRALWDIRREGEPFDPDAERRTETLVRDLLEEMHAEDPSVIRPIAGALEVFNLVRSMGHHVAVATGAWRSSAELKLDRAGLPVADVPLVTATERVGRPDIIREAVRRAGGEVGADRVVYVGDGLWDARATAALGIPLIGRGTGEQGAALADAGATTVLEDFTDQRTVRAAIRAHE